MWEVANYVNYPLAIFLTWCPITSMAREMSASKGEGRLVFVCDIRSTDHSMSHTEQEERILLDMKMQQDWVRVLQPNASMLKFRLPYDHAATPHLDYLDGQVMMSSKGFLFYHP